MQAREQEERLRQIRLYLRSFQGHIYPKTLIEDKQAIIREMELVIHKEDHADSPVKEYSTHTQDRTHSWLEEAICHGTTA